MFATAGLIIGGCVLIGAIYLGAQSEAIHGGRFSTEYLTLAVVTGIVGVAILALSYWKL